ncbi:induced myeloid leukemia cell differentiation [Lynx pardinus]|uniref:Induced myeloid leukemia cell differentiation n=1 Tax=Lynx pardinus TaxID=191816 RepID=A0A485PRV3_LYNPA|nr:induced myeloid leukemia cell differentiation [Lynx pardinus]
MEATAGARKPGAWETARQPLTGPHQRSGRTRAHQPQLPGRRYVTHRVPTEYRKTPPSPKAPPLPAGEVPRRRRRRRQQQQLTMFGLKRNAVIGLNLYCGGAGLAAGSGGASSSGGRLVAVGKEATARREVGGGEAGALVGEASSGPGTDGSLPSTPPPAEEEEDELFRQSLEIISRYLREQATGAKDAKPLGGSGAASRKALETLRRVGDGVQRNHETAFQGMLRKLDIKNEDDVKSLSRVMVHVFSDGVTNWGRIVTLISFGAFVAKHLKSINQESCIEPLAESITDVLVRTKRDWLVKQRGWDGFVEFFHVEDLEGGIRNVLLAFAGVAGVGAGLAYLIR